MRIGSLVRPSDGRAALMKGDAEGRARLLRMRRTVEGVRDDRLLIDGQWWPGAGWTEVDEPEPDWSDDPEPDGQA